MKNIKDYSLFEKQGFVSNIEKDTLDNDSYRKVLYTASGIQLVLMNLKPGEEIGEEIHNDIDQFFRFEEGEGIAMIDGKENKVKDGSGVIVPAGAKHNIINTGTGNLKLYSLYAPPKHEDGIDRKDKKDTVSDKEKFTGKTTE